MAATRHGGDVGSFVYDRHRLMGAQSTPAVLLDLVAALRSVSPDDAPALERLGAVIAASVPDGDDTPAATARILSSIEQCRDAREAGLLLVLARLGRRQLREPAMVQLCSLRQLGIISPVERQLGCPTVLTAWAHTLPRHELLMAGLHRPDGETQIAWVLLGGRPMVVVAGDITTGRIQPSAADAVQLAATGPGSRCLSPTDLRQRLYDATPTTTPVRLDPAVALTLLWSAVGGSPDALPTLAIRESQPAQPGDRLEPAVEDELADFEVWVVRSLGHDSAAWRVGDLVAGAMIEYGLRVAERPVAEWTPADLADFMLVWLPRHVLLEADALAEVPEAAAGFLRFLSQTGRLDRPMLDELLDTCLTAGRRLLQPAQPAATLSPRAAAIVRALAQRPD
jgi:hypothetical protein